MTCACTELKTDRLKAAQWDKQSKCMQDINVQTSDEVSFSSLIIGYNNIGSSNYGSVNGANEGFKFVAAKTKILVSESLLVGGGQKTMRNVIFVEKKWIEGRFIQPLQQLQRKRIAGPQYGLSPPPQQKNNNYCTILQHFLL